MRILSSSRCTVFTLGFRLLFLHMTVNIFENTFHDRHCLTFDNFKQTSVIKTYIHFPDEL